MNIQYKPTDGRQPHERAMTNIGEFYPNEVKGVDVTQEAEAQKLIANGEFVETDAEPNTDKVAEAAAKSKAKAAKSDADAKAEASAAQAAPSKSKK